MSKIYYANWLHFKFIRIRACLVEHGKTVFRVLWEEVNICYTFREWKEILFSCSVMSDPLQPHGWKKIEQGYTAGLPCYILAASFRQYLQAWVLSLTLLLNIPCDLGHFIELLCFLIYKIRTMLLALCAAQGHLRSSS